MQSVIPQGFDDEGVYQLRLIVGICGAFSFIFTSLVLLDSLSGGAAGAKSDKGGEKVGSRVVFFLILADWAQSLSSIMSLFLPADGVLPFGPAASVLCQIQAFMVQYLTLAVYFWTLSLAIHAFFTVVLKWKKSLLIRLLFWVYLPCNVLLPLLPAIVGQALHFYGPPGPSQNPVWCWVKPEFVSFRLGALYFPFLIIWLLNAVLFISVIIALYRLGTTYVRAASIRIALYLSIFLVGFLPGLLNRSFQAFDVYQTYWLYALQSVCDNSVGFADSLVYGLTPERRRFLSNLFSCRKNPVDRRINNYY